MRWACFYPNWNSASGVKILPLRHRRRDLLHDAINLACGRDGVRVTILHAWRHQHVGPSVDAV